MTFSGPGHADPVKGEATFAASGGYARLVLKLAEDVDSEVTAAGTIIVVRFKRPVDIPVDKIADAVPSYVSSARRDPDGSAIRLSLARRVTINTMTAGERIFVDLLPDSWTGLPPGLPPEVIRELSERARAAERALRQQRAASEATKRAPIRVRALVQPTFVRYVFEMPDGVGVSSVLNDQKLTLSFNALLNFDLADAKVAAPSNVESIKQKVDGESTAVEVALIGDVDVHSFREDKNYIVDVAFQQAEKPAVPSPSAAEAPPAPATASRLPVTAAPAPSAPEKPAEQPAAEPAAPRQSGEVEPVPAPKPMPAAEAPMEPSPPKEAPAAVAEAPAKTTLAAAEPPPEIKNSDSATAVDAKRSSDGLTLKFSFAVPTPAALFRRADTVWLVFDSTKPIDVEPIRSQGGALIADVSLLPLDKGQAVRIRLNRPQMPSLTGDDQDGGVNWTLMFADTMRTPAQPLTAVRNISDPVLANVTIPLTKAGRLHRLTDPDAGDTIMVVTAAAPVRGFLKQQDFVELSLLETIHGVAVRPNSDDVTAEVSPDKVILGKPGGLTLSSAEVGAARAPTAARPIFDVGEWRKNQEENFTARLDALVAAASAAAPDARAPARIDLARFYMSRGLYHEARAVLDLAMADFKPGAEDPVVLIVHAVASILTGRPGQGLKDLASPAIGSNYDSQLWKALAYVRQGKWADAREKFKNADFAITSLPIDLQRIVVSEAMRASLEAKDYSGAAKRGDDLEIIGVPPEIDDLGGSHRDFQLGAADPPPRLAARASSLTFVADLKTWVAGARPRTLPAAIVPVVVGTGVAIGYHRFWAWRAVLALVVALALQIGVNYANDYSDGIRGTDEVRVGPVRLVAAGWPRPGTSSSRPWPASRSPGRPGWFWPRSRRGGCCSSAWPRSRPPGSTRGAASPTATVRSARSRCSCSSAWSPSSAPPMCRCAISPGCRSPPPSRSGCSPAHCW